MLYNRIKDISKSKKIPLYKIEQRLELARGSIGKWRKNKPSYDKVVGVAKILGVSVEELVGSEVNTNE